MATTADLFVLVFGGVSVTLPTAWLRSRVSSIVAGAGPEQMRTNASDDDLVRGILIRPEELLLSTPDLIRSSTAGLAATRELVPF
jgi:hypothetical protein